MKEKVKEKILGVAVGRFQVPELHRGHICFLDKVVEKSDRVLVFIGRAQSFPDKKDPLSYKQREEMLRDFFKKRKKKFKILPIDDLGNNRLWSEKLDEKIAKEKRKGEKILLFGSRDSFVFQYEGKSPFSLIKEKGKFSGTESRKKAEVYKGAAFRAGIVYAFSSRRALLHQTVDILPYFWEKGKLMVLLAQKKRDAEKFRFLGGFTDISDLSLEDAALRELKEESPGLTVKKKPFYLGSRQVDDWRYKNREDGIMTALFAVEIKKPKKTEAADDIDYLKIFSFAELKESLFIKEHRFLFKLLKSNSLFVGSQK